MALPKKGLRKITVNNQVYTWKVTSNDYFISLNILLLNNNGQLLTANFNYRYSTENNKVKTEQVVITPNIVKQVIEYALKNGWGPNEKKTQMQLDDMGNKLL